MCAGNPARTSNAAALGSAEPRARSEKRHRPAPVNVPMTAAILSRIEVLARSSESNTESDLRSLCRTGSSQLSRELRLELRLLLLSRRGLRTGWKPELLKDTSTGEEFGYGLASFRHWMLRRAAVVW
jgi:hypothetical protein